MVLHLDRTVPESTDARARMQIFNWHSKLRGKTHFSDHELRCVLLIFLKLTSRKSRYLPAPQFFYVMRVAFEINDKVVLNRLFSIFESPRAPGVGPREWVHLLDVYLHGTLEEQIVFNWRVYNNLGLGELKLDDLVELTRSHLGPWATDEERNEYADDILNLFDKDGDEKISFEDFKTTVMEAPSELNTLSRACPAPHVALPFLATFSPKMIDESTKSRKIQGKQISKKKKILQEDKAEPNKQQDD